MNTSVSTSPLYSPLQGSEIRLIYIHPGDQKDPLICDIHHVLLDNQQPYFALSYVWGDEKDKKPIILSGHPWTVTKNLYEALMQLREWLGRQEPIYDRIRLDPKVGFWVDAVCINQADIKEKSKQIPRMGKIYSSATQVLAWLGPNESGQHAETQQVFEKATQLVQLYEQPDVGLAALPAFSQYLFQEYGAVGLKAICETILKIIQRPWFSRVWVVQEAALSRDPAILLAGRATTTIHNLYFLWATLRMYVEDGLVRQDLVAGVKIAVFESTRLMVQSEDWRTVGHQPSLSSFAQQLHELLDRVASRLTSTLPQDMIYGILAMVNLPTLPDYLLPDYSKPWTDVYREYCRFLIESTKNLALLPTTKNLLTGVPSWVPDFRQLRFGTTGIKAQPPTLAMISFSPDNTLMTLEGVELYSCVSSFQIKREYAEEIEKLVVNLPRFERFIIEKAAQILHSSMDKTLKQWLNFLLDSSHYNASRPMIDDFYKIYCLLVDRAPVEDIDDEIASTKPQVDDAAEAQATENQNDHTTNHKTDESDVIGLVNLLRQSLTSLSHFVTTSGSIGMLMCEGRRALPGDRVCVFKGSIYPSLIRPCGERYYFLGGCRLNDMSNEQAYNEEFFDQQVRKHFTLV